MRPKASGRAGVRSNGGSRTFLEPAVCDLHDLRINVVLLLPVLLFLSGMIVLWVLGLLRMMGASSVLVVVLRK